MDQADDADVVPAEDAVEVGQGVLAGVRVQEVGSREVAQSVAQGHQPAEGADVRGRQGDAGVLGAQRGGGEVKDEVVGADGDDRLLDLVRAAQQLDLHLVTGVVAFHPGGHHEQAVGADQRGEHAGAARQRGRDHRPAHLAQPHPHPVVHAERGGQLAGQPRPGPRPAAGHGSLQLSQQGRGEDVEGQRGRYRVAGCPENRRAFDDAQDHRMARPDRDAVHGQGAELGHDPGGVVVAARARARHDDQQVAGGHGGAHGAGEGSGIVGLDRQAARRAAGLADLGGQHERVGV